MEEENNNLKTETPLENTFDGILDYPCYSTFGKKKSTPKFIEW